MTSESETPTEQPDLPEPFGLIGLFIGLGLSAIYYRIVMVNVPDGYFPLHIVLLVPIVFIFLGVPASFERIYWRWVDDR